jgi:hypothetical protein
LQHLGHTKLTRTIDEDLFLVACIIVLLRAGQAEDASMVKPNGNIFDITMKELLRSGNDGKADEYEPNGSEALLLRLKSQAKAHLQPPLWKARSPRRLPSTSAGGTATSISARTSEEGDLGRIIVKTQEDLGEIMNGQSPAENVAELDAGNTAVQTFGEDVASAPFIVRTEVDTSRVVSLLRKLLRSPEWEQAMNMDKVPPSDIKQTIDLPCTEASPELPVETSRRSVAEIWEHCKEIRQVLAVDDYSQWFSGQNFSAVLSEVPEGVKGITPSSPSGSP